MDIKKPTIVSLFSGAGGLDIGFEQAGFQTVFANDIWDVSCETLIKNKISQKQNEQKTHRAKNSLGAFKFL